MRRCSAILVLNALVVAALRLGRPRQEIKLIVTEENSAKPLPCRIHLSDKDGKPVKADKLPFWRDHFVCPGEVRLELAPGNYSYGIERGPEYQSLKGSFACVTAT